MTEAPLRDWFQTKDGYEYREGRSVVGYALKTEYGTICFGGPKGRGTAGSIEGAKRCVEQHFDPSSPFSQMIEAAKGQLSPS